MGRTLPSGLRVLASLGETPEGCLYSAKSPTGREVALLVPRSENDLKPSDGQELVGRVRQRIRQERIRQVMQIHHPNVAEVHETGETADGAFYIVLEPLAGELLWPILAARGPRPVHEAVELCLQVAAGLEAAHALGVVHGNVSPQTIIVARTADGRPRLKLMGFSIGLFLRGDRPEQRASAQYASPEQRCRVAADERSDVFSLGALLHHLLAGAPPESGSVADSVPKAVRAVLAKALADAPAQRFQSVSAFAAALERAAGVVSPPKAPPVSPPHKVRTGRTRLRKTAKVAASRIRSIAASVSRRRLLETAGAALIVSGIWLFWSSYREAISAEVRASLQEARRVVLGDRDSALRHTATMPPVDTARRRVEGGTSSTPPPKPTPAAAPARKPSTARAPNSAKAKTRTGTASVQPLISPYRRSHPWAAPPGGRFYYRSSCPEALLFTDLRFFTSEREARASGLVPTRVPGCH